MADISPYKLFFLSILHYSVKGRQHDSLFAICIIALSFCEPSESLNWTAQPTNPTRQTLGREVSLSWSYILTADEQTKSQTYFLVKWEKFNLSTSSFHAFASYLKVVRPPQPLFGEPNAPRIVVDRSTGTSSASLQFKNVRSEDEGMYKIEVSVEFPGTVGVAHQEFNVTVLAPSKIKHTSENQTVNQNDRVYLNCTAEGLPTPNISWTRLSDNGVVSMPLNITGRKDQGSYICTAYNGIGDPDTGEVFITVQNYSPENAVLTTSLNDNTADVNEVFNITCRTEANPPATFRFYKDGNSFFNITRGSNVAMSTTSVSERRSPMSYSCIPVNEYGDGPTATITITMHYPPKIIKPMSATVQADRYKSVTVECLAEANPSPSYVWTNAAGGIETVARVLSIRSVDDLYGRNYTYTCTATNIVGFDKRSVSIKITRQKIPLEVTLTELVGVKIVYQPDYKDLNSTLAKAFVKEFVTEVNKKYENNPNFYRVEVTKLGKGSVIVSLVLHFKNPVTTNEGLAELLDALIIGTIGRYSACCLKMLQDVDTTTAPNSVTSAIPHNLSVTTEGTTSACPSEIERCQCNEVLWKAISGVLIFIIILLVIAIIWQQKRGSTAGRKRAHVLQRHDAEVYDNEIAMDKVQPSRPLKPEYMDLKVVPVFRSAPSKEARLGTSQVERLSRGTDYAPLHPSTRSWEIARNNVTIEKVIGKGAFGQVAKGTAIDLWDRPGKTSVAVKMLKASAPESDRKDLLSELELMKTLKPHPHVVRLLGCVTEFGSLLVLIEYVPYGDLLGYLRKSRGLNDTYYKDPDIKPQTSLTSQQLMKFAWQVADGMSYLSSRSIIHRDLAARNVLVGERETCKVTDFGMARDVHQENIYERKTRGRLPVKWTAYEALLFNTYTTKSDVWSYGIVLYEIFTVGGSPYPRMDGKKIASFLQQGHRMPKPLHVADKLYEIMMNCWKNEPDARPSFITLAKQLKDMEKQHQKLINMHIYDNQLYAKVEDLNV